MRKLNRGVTLLELMITVAIVAIIAAIAYPSYRQQVIKSNRSEAKIALVKASQALETCYTHERKYTGCAPVKAGATENGIYAIAFEASDITDHTFKLTALPQGSQADDEACAAFIISEKGQSAQKADKSDNTKECWK